MLGLAAFRAAPAPLGYGAGPSEPLTSYAGLMNAGEAWLEAEDFSKAMKTERHVYDYVFTDSKNERTFAKELDSSTEVVVYAKLPRSFFIPTPVGNYNPDWAIAFEDDKVKHVYFIAETKGSMSSMELRKIEECKIDCARKFFTKITSEP